MSKILLIDNGSAHLQRLETPLQKDGHKVYLAEDGAGGLKIAWNQTPELTILNLQLSTMDGYETCRRLREMEVPFILVTSPQHDERRVIKALEMGADDYLRNPIEVPILLAKIRTLMRRTDVESLNKSVVFDDGHLFIDLGSRVVQIDDQPVKLTPTEFRLLSVLLRQAGRPVTHEDLIREIWGTEKETSLGSLKLYIHYLRQKLEEKPRKPRYVLAEWGVGYRFREVESEILSV